MSEPAVREPNETLRAVRKSLLMSQGEFALAIRAAGQRAGEPNDCSKRLVQRWEAGYVTGIPRGAYARALEAVTGQPIENLGFGAEDTTRRQALGMAGAAGVAAAAAWMPEAKAKGARGPLTGIWRSAYTYVSSSRGGKTFTSEHYVHGHPAREPDPGPVAAGDGHGPGDDGPDHRRPGDHRHVDEELTDPDGYYKSSTYSGAIHMLLDHTGHRMKGKWLGFDRDGGIRTAPGVLDLVSADTGKAAVEQYNRPVEPADADDLTTS